MMKRYFTFLLLFGISFVYPADLIISVQGEQGFGIEIGGQGNSRTLRTSHTFRNLSGGNLQARLFFPAGQEMDVYDVEIELREYAESVYTVLREDEDCRLELVSVTQTPGWAPAPSNPGYRPGPGPDNRPGNRPGYRPLPGNRPDYRPGSPYRPGNSGWNQPNDEAYFQELLMVVDRQFSDANKIAVIRHALPAMGLTTAQMSVLLDRLSFENGKQALAIEAYPYILDPERYFLIVQNFTFTSHVRVVAEEIMKLGPVNGGFHGYNRPANPADFQAAMTMLRNQSFEQTRLLLARWIAMSLPLDSRQVALMMETMTFESSRLELAKSAYPFVLDPQRYFVVFNAFQFQSSARNFDTWLRTQRV